MVHKRERERESAFVVLPLAHSIKRMSSTKSEKGKGKDEPTMKVDYHRTSEKENEQQTTWRTDSNH